MRQVCSASDLTYVLVLNTSSKKKTLGNKSFSCNSVIQIKTQSPLQINSMGTGGGDRCLRRKQQGAETWKAGNRAKSCPHGTEAPGLVSFAILHCTVQYFLEDSSREAITFKSQEYIIDSYPQNDYYQKCTKRQLIIVTSTLRKFVLNPYSFGGEGQGLMYPRLASNLSCSQG